MSSLFVFGLGYSALATAAHLAEGGWPVTGTVRSREKLENVARDGITPILFSDAEAVGAALQTASHCLVSVPPEAEGDPALLAYRDALLEAPELHWIGYLSTIGVYGDHGGGWVDEETPVSATVGRRSARAEVEIEWTALAKEKGIALDIFRLAGIYGPGRSPIDRIRSGEARWIHKAGQVFNRIHVDDIAQTVIAAIRRDRLGGVHIFNVTDDEPAPNPDVLAYAADLIGVPKPPLIPYEEAELSPMARSFYEGNKRVHNAKIKRELGVLLRYPTYREGLRALAREN
ncbi:SDR family oxidoreductase [Rhodomicrobium lacus]|uniref:SDR family oxidoreductase n=1 Tax=Rhodomicrobium lacus TaxID=2498452 RepID=UPI0026E3AC72|nr:SDR family oxidoreductase [Rhodomicrobium lacus]WKW51789.1 SDR family oxidoreductase [Rhodomicrobium lacus]